MSSYVPDRGDFTRLVLDPYVGREQGGERPVLVLSSRAFHEATGYALVAPVTNRRRGWPFEVAIEPGQRVSGVVLADQTRSIDFAARHARLLGKASPALLTAVRDRVVAIVEDEV